MKMSDDSKRKSWLKIDSNYIERKKERENTHCHTHKITFRINNSPAKIDSNYIERKKEKENTHKK